MTDTMIERARAQQDRYAGGADRPLAGYLGTMATYAGLVAGVALLAPFASYEGTAGPAELREEVRGTGGRKTIGEMVTCPFCASVWVGTALTAGLVCLPRTTRLATATLTALAGADLLQYAHALLEKAAS